MGRAASGRLRVRSAVDGPLGTVEWFNLEKAAQPGDVAGLDAPPLRRDGQLLLPSPTHRPRSRPADKYANP